MTDAPETFGQRLARLRLARMTKPRRAWRARKRDEPPVEWSQEWLAHELGFRHDITVWNWEHDLRLPSADTMPRLAHLLGVSEHYLRYGTEEPRIQILEALRAAILEGRTYDYLRTIAGVP